MKNNKNIIKTTININDDLYNNIITYCELCNLSFNKLVSILLWERIKDENLESLPNKQDEKVNDNILNKWFVGCNKHHINENNILCIPKELHRSIKHNKNNPESMNNINTAALEWLCNQEIL